MSGYDRFVDQLPPTSEEGAKGPKINTARFLWTTTEKERKDYDELPDDPEQFNNCALCTAAALTGQTSGEVSAVVANTPFESVTAFEVYAGKFVSKQLRPDVPDRNSTIAKGNKALVDQIIGLAEYVKAKRGTNAKSSMDLVAFIKEGRSDSPGAIARPEAAIHFMKRQPNHTVFAVYTTDGIFGASAHWTCAENRDGIITFTDYQPDRQFPLPAELKTLYEAKARKKLPEGRVRSENPLGPNGLEYKDTTWDSTFMFVWAFGNGVVQ